MKSSTEEQNLFYNR